jgi:hypothetical protein
MSMELVKKEKVSEADAIMLEALNTARRISDEWDKCSALTGISTELAQQGKARESGEVILEALETARGLNHEFLIYDALRNISIELVKQGNISYALETGREISGECEKSSTLGDISIGLAKQGKIGEALELARGISTKSYKRSALTGISSELAQQGKARESEEVILEALETARGIRDKIYHSSALGAISTELAKQGNLTLAEEIGLEIQSAANRHECWSDIASVMFKSKGTIDSLSLGQSFSSEEARLFYQRGWSQALNSQDASQEVLQTALPQMSSDPISIENLLQSHALHCTFFAQTEYKKLQRLNRSLNIQWALEIADKFPKSEESQRLSTNLEDWIEEIPDEDDRDQVRLWAKQVAKARMTEAAFSEKVSELEKAP